MCIQNKKDEAEIEWINKLQYFGVSWRTFFIILVTLFLVGVVLVVWAQYCCEEHGVTNTNCTQVQMDYSCCKVKNFWNPFNKCLNKYETVFENECLRPQWRYQDEEVGFDEIGIGILEGKY